MAPVIDVVETDEEFDDLLTPVFNFSIIDEKSFGWSGSAAGGGGGCCVASAFFSKVEK